MVVCGVESALLTTMVVVCGGGDNGEGRVGVMTVIWNNPPSDSPDSRGPGPAPQCPGVPGPPYRTRATPPYPPGYPGPGRGGRAAPGCTPGQLGFHPTSDAVSFGCSECVAGELLTGGVTQEQA